MLTVTIICPPRDGKIRKEKKEEFDRMFFVHQYKECPICSREECRFLVKTEKTYDKLPDEEYIKILSRLEEEYGNY